MRETVRFVAFTGLLLAVPAVTPLMAQDVNAEQVTVWAGVFTAEQSARGRAHFNASCSSCHTQSDTGSDIPELEGEAFLEDWGEDNLNSLFELISNSMPAREPGSLTEEVYVEIVAYMLESNGFPAGDQELLADRMATIRVEGRDGPRAVPDFSLVEVRGCLGRDADGNWIVTSATTPVRTRDPSASPPDALQAMSVARLGTGIFELIYVFPSPDAYEGHRIEVKGLLLRDPDPDQINLSSLSSIAEMCQ